MDQAHSPYGDPVPGPPMGSAQAKAQSQLDRELAISAVKLLRNELEANTYLVSNLNKEWKVVDVSEDVEGRSFTFKLASPTGQAIEFRLTIKATGNYFLAGKAVADGKQ